MPSPYHPPRPARDYSDRNRSDYSADDAEAEDASAPSDDDRGEKTQDSTPNAHYCPEDGAAAPRYSHTSPG